MRTASTCIISRRSLSRQSKSTPLRNWKHCCSLRHSFLSSASACESGNSSSTEAVRSYTGAILHGLSGKHPRSLICAVGKAILTKAINPWASDGPDLIPSTGGCGCLCALCLSTHILRFLGCDVFYFAHAQKQPFSQWCSICKVIALQLKSGTRRREPCKTEQPLSLSSFDTFTCDVCETVGNSDAFMSGDVFLPEESLLWKWRSLFF